MSTTKSRKPRVRGNRAKSRPGPAALGITRDDDLSVIRHVRSGFPFSRVTTFEKTSGLPRETIARFAAIPQRTLTRRQQEGRLQPDESDRLLRAARVFEMTVQLFEGDTAAARRWLETPQSDLDGMSPLEFASTEIGARCIEDLIGQLEHGVFT